MTCHFLMCHRGMLAFDFQVCLSAALNAFSADDWSTKVGLSVQVIVFYWCWCSKNGMTVYDLKCVDDLTGQKSHL